jgi:hypothetical protein
MEFCKSVNIVLKEGDKTFGYVHRVDCRAIMMAIEQVYFDELLDIYGFPKRDFNAVQKRIKIHLQA